MVTLVLTLATSPPATAARHRTRIAEILNGAYKQVGAALYYDGSHRSIPFPAGDVPISDRRYVLWMMANVEGYSELRAEAVDGEIHATGQGRDPGGELVERGRYYDISAEGYSLCAS